MPPPKNSVKVDGDGNVILQDLKAEGDLNINIIHTAKLTISIDDLRKNSRSHYQQLQNSRFKHALISETIFPKSTFFESRVAIAKTADGLNTQALSAALKQRWNEPGSHVFLLGEGGMGKTISCLHLWETWLEDTSLPIPLFVPLHEFNAIPSEEQAYTFIKDYLIRHYLLDKNLFEPFLKGLADTQERNNPKVLLILDGLNEVTRDPDLVSILNQNIRECSQWLGIQLLLTSRYELGFLTPVAEFASLHLIPLAKEQIQQYLKENQVDSQFEERLSTLLGNPMYLSLYAATSEILKKNQYTPGFYPKPAATTAGELLWNFNESQFVKLLDQNWGEERHINLERADFFLRFMAPWLAYHMEQRGQFTLPEDAIGFDPQFNFVELCEAAFTFFDQHLFPSPLDTRFSLDEQGNWSTFYKSNTPNDQRQRGKRKKLAQEWLCTRLNILVLTEEGYNFRHQNFRDFYAACHLLNLAELTPDKANLPTAWKERPLPKVLIKLMADIEGEHLLAPVINEFQKAWVLPEHKPKHKPNRIAQLLSKCRAEFDDEAIGYLNWNLLQVMIEGRGNLAGADLSQLNLRRISLNNVELYKHYGSQYLSAKFEGSSIGGKNLIFQGAGKFENISLSPDETKLLVSEDNSIFEISLVDGVLIQKITDHSGPINSICYDPTGKKILTASTNGVAREWLIETGQKIAEYGDRKESGHYNSAAYSPCGSKIVVTTSQSKIQEWSIDAGICIAVYPIEGESFSHAFYSTDGRFIFSRTTSAEVHQWKIGNSTPEFIGKHAKSSCPLYSPTKGTIAVEYYGKIEEWRVGDELVCLNQIHLPKNEELLAWDYSFDGKLLLFATNYRIYEWNIDNKTISRIITRIPNSTEAEWLAKEGVDINNHEWYQDFIEFVCFCHDSQKIMYSTSGAIKILNRETGRLVQSISSARLKLSDLNYHNNGCFFVTSSEDRALKEWSVFYRVCIQVVKKHGTRIASIEYSPDGSKLLTATWPEGMIRECDRLTGEVTLIIPVKNTILEKAIYSPDGTIILAQTQDAILEWGTSDKLGNEPFILEKPGIQSVFYDSTGSRLLLTFEKYLEELNSLSKEQTNFIDNKSEPADFKEAKYSGNSNKILTTRKEGSSILMINNSKRTSLFYDPSVKYFLSAEFNTAETLILCISYSLVLLRNVQDNFDWSFSVLAHRPLAKFNPIFGSLILSKSENTLREVDILDLETIHTYQNEFGLLVQSCDFRNIHPDSQFSEEDKTRLRHYGAIFDDRDEQNWQAAIAEAFPD